MAQKNLLAFDMGASSGRAIVGAFNGDTLSLSEVHRFKNEPVTLGKDLYWDFLSLFRECKSGLLKASQNYGDIDSLGFDTWGVDFGLLDKKGALLNNPFHYRHPHTSEIVKLADKRYGCYNLFASTGVAMQPFNTLMQLMAMKRDKNAALKCAKKLLFIPDLFNYFLTGQAYCEQTIVSTSQLGVPGGGKWNREIIEKAGIDSIKFAGIIPSAEKTGKLTAALADELCLNNPPWVYSTASHDTASAVAAVPAEEKDFLYLSSGTWSLLGTVLDKPLLSKKAFLGGYTNEGAADGKIRFLKNIMGMWIIQECRREYELKEGAVDFIQIEELAKNSKRFLCFIDVNRPEFFAPLNMNKKIQTYCKNTGQTVPSSLGETAACVFESLAFAYREAVENLEALTGKKYSRLYIVGGGSNNVLLNQFTANALDKEIIAGLPEATSTGNIICQAKGLGLISSFDEGRHLAKRSFPIRTYSPCDTSLWSEHYEKYKAIVNSDF